MRNTIIIATLLLACSACSSQEEAAAEQRQKAMIITVRKGIGSLRGEIGGRTSQFVSINLVGKNIVCGTVDGNDGDGIRRFSVADGVVLIEQPGDAAGVRAIQQVCSRGRSRPVISRNATFTDISVEDKPPYD
ncbi:MAG: hypothetical protein P0Y64_15895 [Candidatus Sphingomonas colombiensis]|nr:hypothetical protein [Sphingomonas sp.]WEK42814.1 MAG: hypothetical protein P0Y64_15895 [Sphingomonas sp.]